MSKKHIGSSFEDFLDEEGIREETVLLAIKKVIADQMTAAMTKKKVSQVQLAKRMGTSRPVVHRLLDPSNTGVTLETVVSAASALEMEFRIELAPARRKRA